MPTIGAHVSRAGNLASCFENAEKIGAECLQIFGASPQQWEGKPPSTKDVDEYRKAEKKSGLGPVFLHASYLPNLASGNAWLRAKSVENLVFHFQIAEMLGAAGLIFHIGSAKGVDKKKALDFVEEGMRAVLKKNSGKSLLIMENTAGGGSKVGSLIEELGVIFRKLKSPRVKICFDTAHGFEAGIIKYTPQDIKRFVNACEKSFGWKNVVAIHINDSYSPAGSHYDRHDNIGEGKIGLVGFKNLAKNKDFAALPWILEVPGFDGGGPDKKNVDILKKIARKK